MDRRTLALAYGIAEWDSTLRHLLAMAPHLPLTETGASLALMQELMHLVRLWRSLPPDWVLTDNEYHEGVTQARQYITAHQSELAAWLKEWENQ